MEEVTQVNRQNEKAISLVFNTTDKILQYDPW